MASDGETFRVARQQFEGLVGAKPGTTELEPLLATEWKASEDGKSYTFTLREGVKFSDGTDFNAEAVCANFDRWYNWTGVNQSENLTYYYGKLFRGFKTGKTGGIYDSCAAAQPDRGDGQAHQAVRRLRPGDDACRRSPCRARPR